MGSLEQLTSMMDYRYLSSEETLDGISKYLALQNDLREKEILYKEGEISREQWDRARDDMEIFHYENYKSLIHSFSNNFKQIAVQDEMTQGTFIETQTGYRGEMYRYLDLYLRMFEEGNEEIWLYAVQKAPEIIELLSNRENYSVFKYHIKEIYNQLTSIPEDFNSYISTINKNAVLFQDIDPTYKHLTTSYSTEEVFSEKYIRKYSEILTEGIIDFCGSIEQLTVDGEIDEYFLYKNLAPKLEILSQISWKEHPRVMLSVSQSVENMISFSRDKAESMWLKSFEGASRYMSSLFSKVYKNSLRENKKGFPEIFLKFPNAIMQDMLRVTQERVGEGEINSQIYPKSLLEITNSLLQDVDLFGREIRKYYDAVIKVAYEGDPYQKAIALSELHSNLYLNPTITRKEARKELSQKGIDLCREGDFSGIEELICEYEKEEDILSILALYRSLYFGLCQRLFNSSNINSEEIKKVFYKVSTI